MLLGQTQQLGFVLGGVAGVVDLHAVQPPGGDQLPGQFHAVIHAWVRQHHHAAAGFNKVQHGVHRLIPGRVQDAPAHRFQPEQRAVDLVVQPVGQAVLPQHPHDVGLVQGAAVLGKFQRFLGGVLRADRLQLLAALHHGGVAALGHHAGKILQRGAIVGPVAQKVHAVGALIVVGGQLRGGDQMHAVLHRMGVGVANALDRIMIRDGQMRHPGAPRQKRQLGNRCGTIGISRMRMQIARHGG